MKNFSLFVVYAFMAWSWIAFWLVPDTMVIGTGFIECIFYNKTCQRSHFFLSLLCCHILTKKLLFINMLAFIYFVLWSTRRGSNYIVLAPELSLGFSSADWCCPLSYLRSIWFLLDSILQSIYWGCYKVVFQWLTVVCKS